MIIAAILIIIIVVGVILLQNDYDYFVIYMGTVISGVYLMLHLLFIIMAPMEYELAVREREILESSKENMFMERKIIEWNIKLSEQKYYNKHFLFDLYVDDRFDSLTLIK